MPETRFKVTYAGPLVSYQDGGRFGQLRYGVSASGPMDRHSFATAHATLGNACDETALEISLGGLVLECLSGQVTVAVAGGAFCVAHQGANQPPWTALTVRAGETLSVRPGDWGSWAYLAFAGKPRATRWLGHTATHSMSGFGGGVVSTGQDLIIEESTVIEAREGAITVPDFAEPSGVARVVLGPQDQFFTPAAIDAFKETPFTLTDAYDRMGVRLKGATLQVSEALSIPSEPVVRGSVQVAGDGVPTVLLSDHQPTGGYPKIATILSADIDQLVQMRSRDSLRFIPVSAAEAIATARGHAHRAACHLEAVSHPKGSLAQRLMSENLISGIVSMHETDPAD